MTPPQRTFLLRCWLAGQARAGALGWRFLLEETHIRQRQGFASLPALADFLGETMENLESENPRSRGETPGEGLR